MSWSTREGRETYIGREGEKEKNGRNASQISEKGGCRAIATENRKLPRVRPLGEYRQIGRLNNFRSPTGNPEAPVGLQGEGAQPMRQKKGRKSPCWRRRGKKKQRKLAKKKRE